VVVTRFVLALVIVAAVPLSGCGGIIQVALMPLSYLGPGITITVDSPPPLDQLAGVRLPYTLGLHFTSEFASNRWTSVTHAEMSRIQYELGRASVSLFRGTFTQLSQGVVLVTHRPPFRPEEGIDTPLVVEPSIVGFREDHSIWLRVGTYTAHIEYRLVVLDRSGRIVRDTVVKADGEYQGRRGEPAGNYGGAAEAAMRNAIVAIVNEVATIEVPPEPAALREQDADLVDRAPPRSRRAARTLGRPGAVAAATVARVSRAAGAASPMARRDCPDRRR
jgi:hypothetical protein